jgi:hypothetical protein
MSLIIHFSDQGILLLIILSMSAIYLLLSTLFSNRRLNRNLFETSALLEVLKEAHEREQLKHIRLKRTKDNVEVTVDRGSKVVESVHRSITSTTFNVIDTLATQTNTKNTAKKVQEVHDQTVEGVYKTIREVNKQMGGLASSFLKASLKNAMTPTDVPDHEKTDQDEKTKRPR